MSARWFKKAVTSLVAASYVMAIPVSHAEDTDIFFTSASDKSTQPNILFVFDTSGSMDGIPSGDTRKKIEIIKEAMKRILDTTTGVNIGLARFSVPGGPILYPVVDVDKPTKPNLAIPLNAGDDDVEEATSGVMSLTSSDLDLMEEGGAAKFVGLRFNNVNIPQGAKIVGAAVNFYVDTVSTGNITIKIDGEKVGNASPFSSLVKNLSLRPGTTAAVDWSPSDWTETGVIQSTADISSIIDEITSQNDWCGGNSLVLRFQRKSGAASNMRIAESYNGNSVRAATLRIIFEETFDTGATKCYTNQTISQVKSSADDVEEDKDGNIQIAQGAELNFYGVYGAPNGTNNRAVGLRFPEVYVPRNAVITDAKLSFYAAYANNPSTVIRVRGVDQGDIDSFPSSNKALTAGVPLTSTSADLTLLNWSTPGAEYTPAQNINGVIGSITSRSDWDEGNDLGLVVTYVSGQSKHAKSRELGAGVAPKLTIKYRGVYEPGSYRMRESLKNATDGFKATGNTPISDTLAEAALYYRGENVTFGRVRGVPAQREDNVSHPDSYASGTHYIPPGCNLQLDPYGTACKDESISSGAKYITPITDACQSNYIVYLTDGEPTSHSNTTSNLVKGWTGTTCPSNDQGVKCTKDIAKFLATKDQSPLPGDQFVKTYTVGFDLGGSAAGTQFMKDVATAGGGEFYGADSTDGLIEAFNNILNSILQDNATFVSAGVTVSQTNRLTHDDQLYFSLFGPTVEPRWPGNLKRYRLSDSGTLVDANNMPAVNPSSDQFLDTSKSYWSPTVDGNNPRLGGVASQLNNARSVYTNVSGTSNIDLLVPDNAMHESNSAVTQAMLGAVSATERTELLKWARGIDVDNEDQDENGDTTDASQIFGDPLHSQPSLIRYSTGTTSFLRVFVGTNQGYLHAIDPADGSEEWAFIPKDLLGNLKLLRDNQKSTKKPYGLDASATVYLKDVDKDGTVDIGTDKAYLYIGMRRGGNRYYGLDVSNPAKPVLMFIMGDAEFSKIGQTWSQPVLGMVKTGPSTKSLALIFGGGYDPDQDTATAPQDDDVGNVVYMAYADGPNAGKKIWGSDEISGLVTTNSFPAHVGTADLNGDGLVDHIYAADMRAQIFRFDIDSDGSIMGKRIAHLQPDAAGEVDNRRFYARPDLSVVQRPNGDQFVAISIGSGFREKPLGTTIEDRFYVLRDEGVFNKTFPDIGIDDLVDITNLIGDANDDGESDALAKIEDNEKSGWYLDFDQSGEKVLAESTTFNGMVFFTTYTPPGAANVSECGGDKGSSRLYIVSLLDGNPILEKRYVDVDGPTAGFISPQIIVTPDGYNMGIGNKFGNDLNPNIEDLLNQGEFAKRAKWRRVTQ